MSCECLCTTCNSELELVDVISMNGVNMCYQCYVDNRQRKKDDWEPLLTQTKAMLNVKMLELDGLDVLKTDDVVLCIREMVDKLLALSYYCNNTNVY